MSVTQDEVSEEEGVWGGRSWATLLLGGKLQGSAVKPLPAHLRADEVWGETWDFLFPMELVPNLLPQR